MLTITVPGGQMLQLAHLVLDYNGTIALDGRLIEGVAERLARLAPDLQIHVLTADTHGTAAEETEGLPCLLAVIPPDNQDQAKLGYIEHIGPQRVAAIGNGRNDCLMLERAALGIAIVGGGGGERAGTGGRRPGLHRHRKRPRPAAIAKTPAGDSEKLNGEARGLPPVAAAVVRQAAHGIIGDDDHRGSAYRDWLLCVQPA